MYHKYLVDGEYLYNYEELVHILINEIKRDILENTDDKDIVSNDMELLGKIYMKKNNYDLGNVNYIINELSMYGYEIVKLSDIQDNLITLKKYLFSNNYEVLARDTEHLRKEIVEIFE